MLRLLISWLLLAVMALMSVTATASQPVVMLEIEEGDTAFAVDLDKNKAWWLVGECRREIPMAASKSKNSQTLSSKPLVDNVSLGSRQIRLEQQFRFDMASDSPTVSIYSSVRNGWSPIPVTRNDMCAQDATCRARLELPEC